MLLIQLVPALCSAEWKLMEGKPFESVYGTKHYIETKMTYAGASSSQNPIVIFWAKNVFNGKSDPVYVKLVSGGAFSETVSMEIKLQLDINKKTAALAYGILYDVQGRIISTDEVKKPVYAPIGPEPAAEAVWLMIKELHEKGAIGH
jgi:hypothetical protein